MSRKIIIASIALAVVLIVISYISFEKSEYKYPKLIYVKEADNGNDVLVISDAKGKHKKQILRQSISGHDHSIMGGVYIIKTNIIYYDYSMHSIVSYNLETGQRKTLITNSMHPFIVSQDESAFVFQQGSQISHLTRAGIYYELMDLKLNKSFSFKIEDSQNFNIELIFLLNNRYLVYRRSIPAEYPENNVIYDIKAGKIIDGDFVRPILNNRKLYYLQYNGASPYIGEYYFESPSNVVKVFDPQIGSLEVLVNDSNLDIRSFELSPAGDKIKIDARNYRNHKDIVIPYIYEIKTDKFGIFHEQDKTFFPSERFTTNFDDELNVEDEFYVIDNKLGKKYFIEEKRPLLIGILYSKSNIKYFYR